ncbi:hypothetical protein BKA69DRAFT_760346 [Paraphysoderma sedebokerense]|nr:hypothetical protein BKA69DRAFT_760346 [Paraphysoderma sedebokerense]
MSILDISNLKGENGLLRTYLPQWFNNILESIQRVFIIHISKVILLCLFITCVKRITLMNLIGFGFMLLGGIWMPGSWYAIVTLWVEIDILAQILFQIPVIQDLLAPLSHLSYYGLTTFPEPALPSSNLSIEIILLFVISLRALSKSWLNQLLSVNPTLPSNQSDWFYFPTTAETILYIENAPGADIGRNDEEKTNNMNDEYNWKSVLREFGNLVNFTLSNIANQVGFEIVLIIHVVVALYRLNVYGVLYIIMNGIWLMEGSRGSSLGITIHLSLRSKPF